MDKADRARQGRRILKNITMDAADLFFMGLSMLCSEDKTTAEAAERKAHQGFSNIFTQNIIHDIDRVPHRAYNTD